jgi:hypothetical protein
MQVMVKDQVKISDQELEEFDPEIGSRRGRMSSPKGEEAASSIPSEGEFLKAFMRMQTMVEELYQDRKKVNKVDHLIQKIRKKEVMRTPLKLHQLLHLFLMVLFLLHLKSKKQKLILICLI